MKLTPLQKRAERKARNQTVLDMNLVSLIDIFTILIFFLLSNATRRRAAAEPEGGEAAASRWPRRRRARPSS